MVQGTPSGPLAVAAVRFSVAPEPSRRTLVLALTEGEGQGVVDGVVLACAASAAWTGGDAQPWTERPTVDCSTLASGDVADDGTTITFDLGTREDAMVDVVLVPATADGAAFNGTNGASFSLVVDPPTPAALVTTGVGSSSPPPTSAPAPPAGGSAPSSGSFSPPAPPPGGSFAQPALPPIQLAPATPDPAGDGESDGDEAASPPTPARPPSVPASREGGGAPSGRELAPLLFVLALGPAGWLATRQPRVALALGLGRAGTDPLFAPAVTSRPPAQARLVAATAIAPVIAAGGPDEIAAGPPAPVLECREVDVRFGGLQALGGVDLVVHEGEIVGLIGPNGAGKTTLMECISGFQRVTGGTIRYRGEDLLRRAPGQRAALGIGRTLQNVRLFPYLTVLDNVRVALHRHQRTGTLSHAFQLPSARAEEVALLDEAVRLVEQVGMQAFAEKFASELSYGTLRLLELACMLALRPSFLLLDEPASGISQKETEALGPLLRQIQADTGSTILMIEHDMPLVMSLSDRVYCLDAGTVLSAGTPQEVQDDPAVAEAYLGTPAEQRKVAIAPNRAEDAEAEMLLEVEGLDVFYDKVQVLYDVDFHVRRGERVALLGTNGAGKSTILKAASGLVTPTAGTIRWKGEDITSVPAERLVRLGLGHVPGGRGLFPTLSVGENLRMGGYIYPDEAQVDAEVERVTGYFPWIAERSDQPAGTLSGGEQQQLATARALMTRPELLMIDELSLGLAPLVIERLMDTVQRMCDEEGLTVVIVEQQASFALGYTDRAYFMEKGEVRYSGPSAGLTERGDLLRSVFLAGASAGFAKAGAAR